MTPFTLEAYKKNPERLRHATGATARHAALTTDEKYIFVCWADTSESMLYVLECTDGFLYLAPLTRKVKCRLYIDNAGKLALWDSTWVTPSAGIFGCSFFGSWHGPEWEEEIPVGDV